MDQETGERVRKWIREGRDPRSAHWQGGLEAVVNLFSDRLEPGKLIAVHPLEERDYPVFAKALEIIDLSPGLLAGFLPPAAAGSITPPESADELVRIAWEKPSYKVLITRPGDEVRLLCAELSPEASNPGIDIFQSGALLGSYNYESPEECFQELTRVVRAHAWEKGSWSQSTHEMYTLYWFEKALGLGRGDIPVQEAASYLHTPVLIKANQVNAVFHLISAVLNRRLDDPEDAVQERLSDISSMNDPGAANVKMQRLVEEMMLHLLSFMKEWKLVAFGDLSNAQSEQFKREFARVNRQLTERLG